MPCHCSTCSWRGGHLLGRSPNSWPKQVRRFDALLFYESSNYLPDKAHRTSSREASALKFHLPTAFFCSSHRWTSSQQWWRTLSLRGSRQHLAVYAAASVCSNSHHPTFIFPILQELRSTSNWQATVHDSPSAQLIWALQTLPSATINTPEAYIIVIVLAGKSLNSLSRILSVSIATPLNSIVTLFTVQDDFNAEKLCYRVQRPLTVPTST
jgi:hypothetical protein